MNTFRQRHPLLACALPSPAQSPFGQRLRSRVDLNAPQTSDHEQLSVKHATFSALMHSARQDGGQLMHDQLAALWPKASPHDLALAQGLGVALWLGDMLLRVREDAQQGIFLFPQDLMERYLVDAAQLAEGRHDFALRRLSEHLAGQALKILQGSAPLGLSAPRALRYRLRWTMLYAGFVLQEMQRDPKAPFIQPELSFRNRLTLLKNTFFISSSTASKGGSCGTGGCST
jgi:hypothetical protein